jgi:inorganic triphosphatase YgiF
VFFFDTPDLRLNSQGVVVRVRRVLGRGDVTVVKLRPIVPGELAQPPWAVRQVAEEK